MERGAEGNKIECVIATGCWKTSVCGVIRPPHRLGSVAKSRSLLVATPPLILALLDADRFCREISKNTSFQMTTKAVRNLSNGASRCGVHSSTPHFSGFRVPCIRAFLISLQKMTFSTGSQGLTLFSPFSVVLIWDPRDLAVGLLRSDQAISLGFIKYHPQNASFEALSCRFHGQK
jgi:hypothetical protein